MSDELMDGALRRALSEHSNTEPGAACLAPETLAGWADGTLTTREQASAELHAANCARCQAMLAAMVRTDGVGVAAPQAGETAGRQHRWRLGLLIPLAAALSAALAWGVLFRPTRNTAPVEQSARASEDITIPRPLDDGQGRPVDSAKPLGSARQRSADVTPPDRALEKATPAAPQSAADALAPEDARNLVVGGAAGGASEGARPEPANEPAAAAPAPATAPAAESSASSIQSFSAAAATANSRVSGLSRRDEALKEQVSVAPQTLWRLGAAGSVQRSTDMGRIWQTQTTGADAPMAAVSAPSLAVCWAAGASGTIVVTVDEGRTWRRAATPDTANLVAVLARDDKTATVTTADGRRFSTTDGGVRWIPVPAR